MHHIALLSLSFAIYFWLTSSDSQMQLHNNLFTMLNANEYSQIEQISFDSVLIEIFLCQLREFTHQFEYDWSMFDELMLV